MEFLKYINMAPKCFNTVLDNTSDVEVLAMIGKLLVEMNVSFKNGIPQYGYKEIATAQCMGAKLGMLTALLNEYQIRRQMVERPEPCYNLPPVERKVFASSSKKKATKATANIKIDEENYIDYAQALHWYCTENYDGMGDPLYEISCKLDYTPGAMERGVDPDHDYMYDEIADLSVEEMENIVKDIHAIATHD